MSLDCAKARLTDPLVDSALGALSTGFAGSLSTVPRLAFHSKISKISKISKAQSSGCRNYIYIYIYMCIDVCRDVCVLMCDQKNYIPRLIFNKFIPTPREPPNLNWFPPLSSPFVQKSSGSRVIQESFSSPILDKRK